MSFAVKWRHKEDKRFLFLTSSGGGNSLKIHAARFADRDAAQKFVEENQADNPDFIFRVQSLS
jgi:hypothetical protein